MQKLTLKKPNLYIGIIKWGVFLAIIFTPLLYVPKLLYPAVFAQVVFFRIIVEILVIFYLLLLFCDKKYLPRFSPILLGISIFVAILILTSIFGVNFNRSFWGTIERTEGLNTILHLFLFFIILTSVFKKEESWLKFFKISILASLAVSIITIIFTIFFYLSNIVSLSGILEGVIGNTAFLAFYLILNIFLCLLVFFREKKDRYRYFYIIILILNFIALIISGARTAIGATILGLFSVFLFFLGSLKKISKKKRILIIGTILSLILLSLVCFFTVKNNIKNKPFVEKIPFLEKILNTSLQSRSLINRLVVWKMAYNGWQEKKLFGWGSENFVMLYQKHLDPKLLSYETSTFDRPHNKFLEILALNGIVGLLGYIFLFSTIFYSIWKIIKDKKANIMIGGVLFSFFVAYIFQNFFLFDTLHSYILFFLMIGFIGIIYEKKIETKNPPLQSTAPGYKDKKIFIFLKIIIFVFTSTMVFISFYKANYLSIINHYYGNIAIVIVGSFQNSIPPVPYSKIPKEYSLEIINSYKKAILYSDYTDLKHFRLKLTEFILNSWDGKSTENLEYISKEVKKNIEIKPDSNDYETYIALTEIYRLLSMKDKKYLEEAEKFAKEAKKINPYDPNVYLLLFKIAYLKGDLEQSSIFYNKATTLNKNLSQPYWNFGRFYLYIGEKNKALVEFEKAMDVERNLVRVRSDEDYAPEFSNITLLFGLYEERKDYQKLIFAYEETINHYKKLIPKNSDPVFKSDYIILHFSLADAYAKNGEKEKAKETALKILKIDSKVLEIAPDIQKQVQEFINRLEK